MEGMYMKKSSLFSISALAAISALTLAGCAADAGESENAGSTRACVILPDADSGTRWEPGDRPALEKALTEAGYEADIQNAQSDTAKYATIADQQLSQGCGVMLLVDYQGAAVSVTEKAQAQGIPDYYLSFDNERVGAFQGQMILDGLAAAGKDVTTASIIYSSGDPADGNAAMFLNGALSVLDAAGAKAAFTMEGTWDGTKAGTLFEQAFTAVSGKVDAVLAPNDNNAASIIAILDKNGLTVPVSGQDASVAGLQNVLLGKQWATVWKPFTIQAEAGAKMAITILSGGTPETNKTLEDGTPFLALDPIVVGPEQVKDVVAAGDASAADLCVGDVAAACEKYGVK
jgi:D-xylose transport system substrate-binding protein